MTPFFRATGIDAEMEATAILGLLESNGIPAMLVGSALIPSLEFIVEVPRERLDEARRVLNEAREAGPDAALEAEENEAAGTESA